MAVIGDATEKTIMILATKNMRPIPLLLAGMLALGPVAEAAAVKNDWSKVRNVQPGMRTWVRRYQSEVPKGQPKVVHGRFASAGPDTITLMLSDGDSVTFEKRAVHRVSVRRPASQRWPAWAAAGGMLALNHTVIASQFEGSDHEEVSTFIGILDLLTIAPVWAAFYFGMTRKPIYDVPKKQRNN